MHDPAEKSQPHRHDELRSDGLWYDNVDQADCSESPVITTHRLPERRPLLGASVPATARAPQELPKWINLMMSAVSPTTDVPDDTWADHESAESIEHTWTDNNPARNRHDIDFRAQQHHENSMQSRALVGVGVLFLLTLMIVVAVPWVGAISEDFARTLAQMVLPALLASGATIIGTLFKPK